MDTKVKAFVIQSNIDALRKEINLRIESQNNLWRLVIAGLAAAVVLKSDIDVGRFLPVVPIVGMLITAYWLGAGHTRAVRVQSPLATELSMRSDRRLHRLGPVLVRARAGIDVSLLRRE